MSILSLLSHFHARAASSLDAPGARAQSKTAAVTGKPAAVTSKAASSSSGASGSSGSSSTGDSSAAITANDFLTLLVTEIQNQDPTSQTDPMTYITQLVGVNSLEQLVQINSTLSAGITTSPATTATGSARTGNSPAANSAAAKAAIQVAQSTTGPASAANGHLLPLGASGQVTTASTNAVAQAFTHPAVMPQQVVSPSEVPLNPDVMRALEHSIPGAKLVGSPSGAQ